MVRANHSFFSAERLAPVFSNEVRNTTEEILKKLPPLQFFRGVTNAETAFELLVRLADALLNKGSLDPRLREIAILAIARLEKSDSERIQSEALARELGITPHQIEAICQENFEAPILNDDRLVLRFVKAWWSDIVSDDLYEI